MDIQINEQPKNKDKKIIGTYVDKTTYDKLQKEADDNFTSLSSLVRKILYFYIQGLENDNNNN